MLNTIYFFILGSVLASFYCVLATRLPENLSILKPRSHCDNCNHELKWYELIPLLSYIIQKGKCRKCQKAIPLYTFLSELALASLFAIFYQRYGFSYNLIISLILSSLLLIIFITDIKYLIILDSPLVISSIIIIITKYYFFGFKEVFKSLIAGIILFSIMYLIGVLGKILFKKEALGGGDIKLSFVIGLTLNLGLGLTSLILSTFLALPYATFSLYTNSNHEVAFGPFLMSAFFVVFIYSDKFLYLINSLIGGLLP